MNKDKDSNNTVITQLISLSKKSETNPKPIIKLKTSTFASSTILIFSSDEKHYKSKSLPCNARGLFVQETHSTTDQVEYNIVIRGYDKFFNGTKISNHYFLPFKVGEIESWESISKSTIGPYETTVKENGCIIFCGVVNGELLVTSKHAFGPNHDDTSGRVSHADKGMEWLLMHLKNKGKSTDEFIKFLGGRLTAVFELADDDFEEHILAYTGSARGLYLHGLNKNTCHLQTLDYTHVAKAAKEFGFHCPAVMVFDSISDVKEFTDKHQKTGSYNGKSVEGFVVRSHSPSSSFSHFFKVKYDQPYLMFREWRTITKILITNQKKNITQFKHTPRFELTRKYAAWVSEKLKTDPKSLDGYSQNKGIIRVRNEFLQVIGLKDGDLVDASGVACAEYFDVQDTQGDDEKIVIFLDKKKKKEAIQWDAEQIEKARLANADKLEKRKLKKQASSPAIPKTLPKTKEKNKTTPKKENDIHTITESLNTLNIRNRSPTLILPSAIVGSGKTTLGKLLQIHTKVECIQSDNIQAKKRKSEKFIDQVMKAFQTHDLVYADKNNHLPMHRETICKEFKRVYPDGKIVGVSWDIPNVFGCEDGIWRRKYNVGDVVEFCFNRIQNRYIYISFGKRLIYRGENHQSLRSSNPDLRKIIKSFVITRVPLNQSNPSDALIDRIIHIPLFSDAEFVAGECMEEKLWNNFEMVCNGLKIDGCGSYDEFLSRVYQPFLQSNAAVILVENNKVEKNPYKYDMKYYGIFLDEPSISVITNLVNTFIPNKKAQPYLHITLSLHPSILPSTTALYTRYEELYEQRGAFGVDGIGLKRLVWNSRIVCCEVLLPVDWKCGNRFAHVTFWVAAGAKGMESNLLLEDKVEVDGQVDLEGVISGRFGGCSFFKQIF